MTRKLFLAAPAWAAMALLAACGGSPGASTPAPDTVAAAATPETRAAIAIASPATPPSAAPDDLRVAVLELRREVADLRTQVNRLPGAREAAATTPPDPRTDAVARQEAQQVERLRIAASEAAFQGEHSDPRWASGTTASIQASFAQADESVRNDVRSVECRSQSCRVEIAAGSDDALNQQLPMLLTQLAPSLPHVTAGQVDQGDGRQATVLFLSR